MSRELRRLYGHHWEDAPPPLRRAVGVIVAAAVVSWVFSVPIALGAAASVGEAVFFLLLFLVTHLVVIGLALLLLRRSRVTWLLLVALMIVGAARVPDGPFDIALYAVDIITLVLLLSPGAVRAVWLRHANAYA